VSDKNYHPDKAAMLRALKEGTESIEGHLRKCEACRIQMELFKAFPQSDDSTLERPSEDAVNRLTMVPLLYRDERPGRTYIGKVAFDSWANQPTAALRAAAPGLIRRLCLKAGEVSLEIVAERHQSEWGFTARVYTKGSVSSCWVLRVLGKRMLPGSLGFYQWKSKHTPLRIELMSLNQRIEFAELSW